MAAGVSLASNPSASASSMMGSSISTTDIFGLARSARIFSRFTSDRVPSNTMRRLCCFSMIGNTNSFM